jgi:hypothetical protein
MFESFPFHEIGFPKSVICEKMVETKNRKKIGKN